MNKPLIEPCLKLSGSAMVGNTLNGTRPLSRFENLESVNVVKLTDLCRANFITIDVGYRLIKLKYLIACRRHHVWWVTCNPLCKQELLDYLGISRLLGDVQQ